MSKDSDEDERPQGEIYPQAIEDAYQYHNWFLDALDKWRNFRDENGQKIALWSGIFWMFQNAQHGSEERGLDINLDEMREGLNVPGDRTWEESLFEVTGLDTDTSMMDIIAGKKELKAKRYDQLGSDIDKGEFIEFGRKLHKKRSKVELYAQMLHNQMFYGGPNNTESDISDGERCQFQKDFGEKPYEPQIKITKKLTRELGKSQFGREILKKTVHPYVSGDGKPQYFRATLLFYPPEIWEGHISDPLVTPPPKPMVSRDTHDLVGLDGNGNPYVKSLKFATTLSVLAGQLMPGVTQYQAQHQGDLEAANNQLSMLLYMIDGGADNQDWKQFKEGSGASEAQTFKSLAQALSTGKDFLDEYRSSSWSRYQVNQMESASRQAKLRQWSLCHANFAGFFSLLGTTWGAVAKANEDQLDFNVAGVYSSIGNAVDAAELYQDWRKLAGMEYDSVGLKNGKFVKYSLATDDPSPWGSTLLDWAGKALDVVDAMVSAYTAVTSAANQEYDVAALAGLGAIIGIASLAIGGWVGVVLAIAGIVVGYLTDWVADGAVTKWVRRSVFGGTDISEETNQNPASSWFGFDGYKRVSAPAGKAKQSGINRQITEFYNLIMPFSVSDPIKIKEQSDGTYSCTFTISDIAMGGVGSSFLIQPIYVKSGAGEYQVGDVSYDIIPIMKAQGSYVGTDQTINGIDLKTVPTFVDSSSQVSDSRKTMKKVKLSFSGADKVSDLFGLSPFKVDGAQSSYLEIIHVPRNFKSAVRTELKQALGKAPSDRYVDTVVDQQPFPRQRSKLNVKLQ